ncbi:hypothetical protein BC629DRAFT_1529852 [Irpex lacteus]|nr:hypothetical protein BC629DRAFT_1529852 [Irpex lacteus]
MDNSSASAQSNGQHTCRLVASWMKICYVDFITIVCVVIFACYVIWGLNLTIRLVSWVRRKFRGNRITLSDTEANLEGRGNTPRRIGPFFRKYQRDASRLQRFMHGPGLVPPTSFLPNLPSESNSPQDQVPPHDAQLQERLRMARFCFPQAPVTASPPPPDAPTNLPLPPFSRPVANTHDPFNDYDHTADLMFNPFWNSHHTHGHGSQSFGMLNFEDAMSVELEGGSVYEEVERAERAAGGRDGEDEDEDESGSSSSDSLV